MDIRASHTHMRINDYRHIFASHAVMGGLDLYIV